jgi:hypothetical protein
MRQNISDASRSEFTTHHKPVNNVKNGTELLRNVFLKK